MRRFARTAWAFARKELLVSLRNPANLFWTLGWPAIWTAIAALAFVPGGPYLAEARGSAALQMVAFSAMTIGMATLPGSIAADREIGLFEALFPLRHSKAAEVVGRLAGLLAYAAVAAAVVLATGAALGGRYAGVSAADALSAAPFVALILLASCGVGLLLVPMGRASLAAGVAIAVATSAVSGVFTPYFALGEGLRAFSRAWPPSSCLHVLKYFLCRGEVERLYDFDPGSPPYVAYAAASSLALFLAGLAAYALSYRRLYRRW